MPEIITDFMLLEEINSHTGVVLGSDRDNAKLGTLQEGQTIVLVYPHNLKAEATIHIIEEAGQRFYYGMLVSDIIPVE